MSVSATDLSPDDGQAKTPWTVFLVVLVIMAVTSGYDVHYTLGAVISAESFAAGAEGGSLTRRVSLMALAAFSIYVMLFQVRSRLTVHPFVGGSILLFLLWCVLSVNWAVSPEFVTRRLIVLVLLTIGVIAFTARCTLRQIMTFALLSSLFTLALSLFAELALGTFMSGPQPNGEPYRFSGVMHPNQQGLNCGILMISAIYMYATTQRNRALFVGLVVLGVAFLLLTKSRTSAISVIVALGFVWFLFSPLVKKLAAALVLALCVPAVFFLAGDWLDENGVAMLQLGRESADPTTLTGRLPLWDHLFDYIAYRPVAGYGYDGFWIPSHVFEISIAHDWPIVQAHSGWITIILDLGYVGIVIFALMIVFGIGKGLGLYRRTRQPGYLFAATMLIWLSVTMLAESVFLTPDLPSFICMSLLAYLGFVGHEQDEEHDATP